MPAVLWMSRPRRPSELLPSTRCHEVVGNGDPLEGRRQDEFARVQHEHPVTRHLHRFGEVTHVLLDVDHPGGVVAEDPEPLESTRMLIDDGCTSRRTGRCRRARRRWPHAGCGPTRSRSRTLSSRRPSRQVVTRRLCRDIVTSARPAEDHGQNRHAQPAQPRTALQPARGPAEGRHHRGGAVQGHVPRQRDHAGRPVAGVAPDGASCDPGSRRRRACWSGVGASGRRSSTIRYDGRSRSRASTTISRRAGRRPTTTVLSIDDRSVHPSEVAKDLGLRKGDTRRDDRAAAVGRAHGGWRCCATG